MYQTTNKSSIGTILLLIITIFCYTPEALAQENTPSTKPKLESRPTTPEKSLPTPKAIKTEILTNNETRQEERASTTEGISEMKQEKQEQRVQLREDKQIALQEGRQKRIINLSANISNRMEAAIARFFDIVARLEQRISKIKETGIDTTESETKLREATASLAVARTKLNNIDSLVIEATTSVTPITKWNRLRETYLDAGKLIRTSQQQLREAISLLKTSPNIEVTTETDISTTTSSSTTTAE
jgi:hypothetical protein